MSDDGSDRSPSESSTDSGAPTDGAPGTESADRMDRARGALDGLRDRTATFDALLILGAMIGLYGLFAIIGTVLGYPLNGVVALVREVTFFTAVYALVVLALNLHWGYAGLFNIGVAGFMAVGAYAFGILAGAPTGSPPGLGLPIAVAVPGAMLAAALVGLVAALPALRLKADYLAIVTIAIAEIIRLALASRVLKPVTGGGGGFGNFPKNPVRGIFYAGSGTDRTAVGAAVLDAAEGVGVTNPEVVIDLAYTLLVVGIVALTYVLLVRIGNSPFGRVLKAIREDELVAESLGKDTRVFKIKAFMVGCALMGLAGIAWQVYGLGGGNVNPTNNFLPQLTFYIFIALIIGGAGSNTGSVLGGAMFAGLLFLLPNYVPRVVEQFVTITARPNTFIDAVAPLASLEVMPFLGYALGNIDQLRFVFVGALLVYLVQRRPEGLLGHRKETASTIDLSERGRPGDRRGTERGRPAADGGAGAGGGEPDE
ncbi:branched-chain amino acid ABC transporter permease [Halobacteriales archaeon QS_5_70_17]|nr:MAG: branched-chain amino acid ABC transporter permease [Halobacteriales archaeon QS_5_70_17]